jgi:hypothetical protein
MSIEGGAPLLDVFLGERDRLRLPEGRAARRRGLTALLNRVTDALLQLGDVLDRRDVGFALGDGGAHGTFVVEPIEHGTELRVSEPTDS